MRPEAPSITQIFGSDVSRSAPRDIADHLADQMLTHHWHVDDLPWNDVALFPIRANVGEVRSRRLAQFYKSVVAVQTRAEEIAVSIARRLLVYAEEAKLDVSFRRALAALLNDEASHVATMLKLEALADEAYPGVAARADETPLFTTLMPEIETIEPAVLSIFMAFYEASVAIRSYAEEQSYKLPSVLTAMAPRAAEDDGRHAKTLRIVAQEFLRIFRLRYGEDERAASPVWRTKILDPFRRYWALIASHEYYLSGNDPRQLPNVRKALAHDHSIMKRILDFLAFTPEAQAYVGLDRVEAFAPSAAERRFHL